MSAPLPPRPHDLAELSDKQELLEKLTNLADSINPLPDPKDLRFAVWLQVAGAIFMSGGVVFIIILAPGAEGFAGIANVIALGVTVVGLGVAFMSMSHATLQSIADARRAKESDAQIMKAIIVVSQQVSAMHDVLEPKQNLVCHHDGSSDYAGDDSQPKIGHLSRFIMSMRHLVTGPK